MNRRALVMAVALGCASCGAAGSRSIVVTRVDARTASDLVSVWCTPTGYVYAVDAQGGAHDLDGHGARLSWDRGGPVARAEHLLYQVSGGQLVRSDDDGARWTALQPLAPTDVAYGRASPVAVAIGSGGGPVFVLGRYTAISDSLESSYAYLVRSDDRGATWSKLWVGPDEGPIGIGRRHGPDVASTLAVLPSGAVALAAVDGSVLLSTDSGRTFAPRQLPRATPLHTLWSGTGGLYGVGSRGAIVVSTDGGRSFRAVDSRVDRDLFALTGCSDHVWIAGAGGTALRE
jgi:hypothetical protein